VAALTSLARVDDTHWLLGGRGTDGRGFAALYSPLDWEVERLDAVASESVRAYLACAGQPDRSLGLCAGAGGAVITREGSRLGRGSVDGGHDLSACAVDAVGRAWVASAGRIWMRHDPLHPDAPSGPSRWDVIWEDAAWTMPIVSVFADLGGIVAMTADGGVIEGRTMRATLVGEEGPLSLRRGGVG
jgi:eukaryotic-like serine/threonine-protein kinase